MSHPIPSASAASPAHSTAAVAWPDAARHAAFDAWLAPLAAAQGLLPATLRPASADASFRRYLRIDTHTPGQSCVVMDAPPDKENCRPFVQVQALMQQAGLQVPQILAWDEAHGFMLLSDLGQHTVIEKLDPAAPQDAYAWYQQATDTLLQWQLASRPGVLPAYDEALLRRELALFPDWYIARHRGMALDAAQQAVLDHAFNRIVAHNLQAPSVFVHRDFMMRNLMVPTTPGGSLGVLDFQDAVYGPITYDIASLLRDAFISWDENFVIDITVRYWEKARKAGPGGRGQPQRLGGRLWRVLPQCRMDGPAAPPEGGRHLCTPDAARRQTQVPAGRAALFALHPRHRRPLPRAGPAVQAHRPDRRHARSRGLCLWPCLKFNQN